MTKQLRIATLGLMIALVVGSCSDNTSTPSNEGTVAFSTGISGQTVTSGVMKADGVVQGAPTIDSIKVDSIRILISRIKLHRSEDDTSNGGRDVKAGPAVISFTHDTTRVAFNAPLPVGLYRKMKLEKHKFSANEAANYASHPVFGDFAFPERITLIVNGTLYGSDGINEFEITSDKTENVWFKFEPDLEITASTTTSVEWNFDAVMVFRSGGRLRDPRVIQDLNDISDALKDCWKVFKK